MEPGLVFVGAPELETFIVQQLQHLKTKYKRSKIIIIKTRQKSPNNLHVAGGERADNVVMVLLHRGAPMAFGHDTQNHKHFRQKDLNIGGGREKS
jgi:predicted double-glycine peptidase